MRQETADQRPPDDGSANVPGIGLIYGQDGCIGINPELRLAAFRAVFQCGIIFPFSHDRHGLLAFAAGIDIDMPSGGGIPYLADRLGSRFVPFPLDIDEFVA